MGSECPTLLSFAAPARDNGLHHPPSHATESSLSSPLLLAVSTVSSRRDQDSPRREDMGRFGSMSSSSRYDAIRGHAMDSLGRQRESRRHENIRLSLIREVRPGTSGVAQVRHMVRLREGSLECQRISGPGRTLWRLSVRSRKSNAQFQQVVNSHPSRSSHTPPRQGVKQHPFLLRVSFNLPHVAPPVLSEPHRRCRGPGLGVGKGLEVDRSLRCEVDSLVKIFVGDCWEHGGRAGRLCRLSCHPTPHRCRQRSTERSLWISFSDNSRAVPECRPLHLQTIDPGFPSTKAYVSVTATLARRKLTCASDWPSSQGET